MLNNIYCNSNNIGFIDKNNIISYCNFTRINDDF